MVAGSPPTWLGPSKADPAAGGGSRSVSVMRCAGKGNPRLEVPSRGHGVRVEITADRFRLQEAQRLINRRRVGTGHLGTGVYRIRIPHGCGIAVSSFCRPDAANSTEQIMTTSPGDQRHIQLVFYADETGRRHRRNAEKAVEREYP